MSSVFTLILGYGLSGRAVAAHLSRLGQRYYVWDDAAPVAPALSLEAWHAEKPSCIRVVVSPGIRPDHPILQDAKAHKIPCVTDIDCFLLEHPTVPTVAVTGTNGKSTVTHGLAWALSQGGEPWDAVGNIGRSPWSLDAIGTGLVFELSSFQLYHAMQTRFQLGVMLPIARDHLDWHGSEAAYWFAKWKIASSESLLIHSSLREALPPRIEALSYGPHGDVCLKEDLIVMPNGRRYRLDTEYYWRGADRENITAIMAAMYQLGRCPDEVPRIPFLPYRAARMVRVDGWWVVNDSKATNLHAVTFSLRAVREARPDAALVLMLGGVYKEPFVLPELRPEDRVVVFGALSEHVTVGERYTHCKEAVAAVKSWMKDGPPGVVLFAPGGSSFDEFSNYAHRGQCFDDWMNQDA